MAKPIKRMLYILLFLVCIPATGFPLLLLGWWMLNMGHELPGSSDDDAILRLSATIFLLLLLGWIAVEVIFQPLLKRIHKI